MVSSSDMPSCLTISQALSKMRYAFQNHLILPRSASRPSNDQPHDFARKYPLIILSNRLPSADEAGGVVKLLTSMSLPQAVLWAGPGATVPDLEWSSELLPEIRKYRDQYLLLQYPVPSTLKQTHYSIIANGILWAALHGLDQQFNQNVENLFGRTDPERQFAEAFAQYRQFNEIATQVIDRWIEPGGIVWVVDYQMVGVRSTIKGTRLMYSNCTPIPDIERLSRMYVGRKPLLEMPDFKKWIEQLCQYNLITLQRFHDLENLIEIGSKIDPNFKKINLSKNIYDTFGNHIRLIDIPVGQNVKSLREEANFARKKYIKCQLSGAVKDLIDRDLMDKANPQKVLALVSRNDYTKGICEAIAAVKAYFETYSGKDIRFLFILQPARTTVVGYEKYHQIVDRDIEKLREVWTDKVIYINQGIPHDELMLLLRDYIDFVLITATHTDGHNLIAPAMLKVSPRNSAKGVVAVEGAGMVDYIGAENVFLCQDLSNPQATAAVLAEAIATPKEQLIARFNRMQQKSLRMNDRTYFNTHVSALLEAEKLGSGLKLDFVGALPPQNQAFRRVLKHALVYALKQQPSASSYQQQASFTRQAEADALRASEAERLLQQGLKQYQTSQFHDSMQTWQQALEICREIGDRVTEGTILNNLGTVHRTLGQHLSALNSFQQALFIAQAVGDQAGKGTVLSNIGTVYLNLGQYPQALDYYQQALSILQSVGDQAGEGGVLNNIGAVYLNLGQYSPALKYYQQALSIAQTVGDRAGEGTILNSIGGAYRSLGKYQQALEQYQQALVIRQAVGDRAGEGITLSNVGGVYASLGQCSPALAYYQQALSILQAVGDRTGAGTTLNNIGTVYRDLGQYPPALTYFQQALFTAQAISDRAGEGTTLNNIGEVYRSLGQYLQALDYLQQALSIAQAVGNRAGEGGILNNIGAVYLNLGQYSSALNYFQQALFIAQTTSDRVGEGRTLNSMGVVYLNLGQSSPALDYLQQALSIAQAVGDRTGEGTTLSNIGGVYLKLRQYSQALNYFQQALSIAQAVGNRTGEGTTLSNIGWAYFKSGQLEAAETSLLEALTLLDTLRQQDIRDADRVSLFDIQVNAYTFLQQVQIAQGKIESALETAERGRARPFVSLLFQRLQASDASIQLPDLSIGHIQRTAKEQNATLVQYSLMYAPSQVDRQEISQPSHLYIWVINPNGDIAFRSVDLTPNNTSLSTLIQLGRETIGVRDRGYSIPVEPKSQQPAQAKRQLQQLYKVLIAPIVDLLPVDSADRIIFIPQAELFLVPFAALRDPDGSYLIQTHTILTAPSIQVLDLTHQLQQTRSMNFSKALIVGNPTMPVLSMSSPEQLLPALPRAEQEAIAIAQQLQTQPLIGDAATETAVVHRMADASVIHLATHGLLEYGNPKASGVRDLPGAIVLAPSAQDDGLLTSSEIFSLKLHASLVVLSACDTGRGDITGDGVISLSRALISAGASSVVVSLWKVTDESTEKLMTEFYRQLQQQPDKAQALRQAMLKTMQQYPDPIDWAAFTLIGEAE